MSTNVWMVEPSIAYQDRGIPFSNKKQQTTDTRKNLDESLYNYVEWKKIL